MLERDPAHGVIAGVCAGLGEHLDIDPIFVRLAFVAVVLLYGVGTLPYVLLWLLMPAKQQ